MRTDDENAPWIEAEKNEKTETPNTDKETTVTAKTKTPKTAKPKTEKPAAKVKPAKAAKPAKDDKPKEPTRPVHVPVSAVKLAEDEAKRTESGIGETIAALIVYALNRKAALAKYAKGATAKKPAKKGKAK